MTEERTGYWRSAKSLWGEARRWELFDKVVDDLGANGLVDFSLRRAARAAGTTHKVLLYYFEGLEDLLTQVVLQLCERWITRVVAVANEVGDRSMAERVRSMWPTLIGAEFWVLDQAIGLAMFDAGRYADLARSVSRQYLLMLLVLCLDDWEEQRKIEVVEFVLAMLRGFLIEWWISGDGVGIEAGLVVLVWVLEREECV